MQIEDPDGILGTHGDSNTPNGVFDADGKVAYVTIQMAKVEVVSCDAATPSSTKIHYSVNPPDCIVPLVSFTAPGTTDSKSNVSGNFYFTYDQGDIISDGTYTIQLEYGDSETENCTVTRTHKMPSDAMEVVGAYFMVENVGQRYYNHSLREIYKSYTYSIASSGKTIYTVSSTALMNFGQDYYDICGWAEKHKYSWSGGGVDWIYMVDAGGLLPENTRAKECFTTTWCISSGLEGIAKCELLLWDYGGGSTPGIITNSEVDRSMPE